MLGGQNNSFVIVDIDILENRLKRGGGYYASGVNISKNKNPNSIRKVKNCNGEKVYDPVVVSIGPYHHGKKTLQTMQKRKWKLMNYILKINKRRNLEDYIRELKKVECTARSYYAEEIKMESSEFLMMLLLDGFFILYLVYLEEWAYKYEGADDISPEEAPRYQMDQLEYWFIMNDLILIENQVPLFVLEILYEIFTGEENIIASLLDKITQLIEKILPNNIKAIEEARASHHMLHLCCMSLRPTQSEVSYSIQFDQDGKTTCWRSGLQYHTAGVQFRKRESHSGLLDVRFTDNVLEIPYFTISGNTSLIFKNIIALEQTKPEFGNDTTAYIIFMSNLVMDTKDVALLVSKGIIEHDLRCEEEIVDLFTRLREGVDFDFMRNFYLKSICHDLETYYQKRMKQWSVWIRRTALATVHGWLRQH